MNHRTLLTASIAMVLSQLLGSCNSQNPEVLDHLVAITVADDYEVGEDQSRVFQYYLALNPEDQTLLAVGAVVPGETLTLDPVEPYSENTVDVAILTGYSDFNGGVGRIYLTTYRQAPRGFTQSIGNNMSTPRNNYFMPEMRLVDLTEADSAQYEYSLRTDINNYLTLPSVWEGDQLVFPSQDLPESFSGRYILLRIDRQNPPNMAFQAVENIFDGSTPVEFPNDQWYTLPTYAITHNLPGSNYSASANGVIDDGGFLDPYYLLGYDQNDAASTFYFPDFGSLFDYQNLYVTWATLGTEYNSGVLYSTRFNESTPTNIPAYPVELENYQGDIKTFEPTLAMGDEVDFTHLQAYLGFPDGPLFYANLFAPGDSPIDFVVPTQLPDSLHSSLSVLQQLDQADQSRLYIQLTDYSTIESYDGYMSSVQNIDPIPPGAMRTAWFLFFN